MKKLGIIEVVLSGICFGFLGLFGKKAFQLNIQAGELLALRYSMAAVLLFIFLLIKNKSELKLNIKYAII
jgi:drug/metabolite transporter (DMT)-like permease